MVLMNRGNVLWKSTLQLQCVVAAFYVVLSQAQTTDDTADFVDISDPPEPFTWRSRIKVKSVCTTDKLIGVTLYVSTTLDKGQYGRAFQKVWRCHANSDSVVMQIRKVRLPLADDIAFRPSLFNKQSTVVEAAKLVVWMVDDIVWWKAEDSERMHMHKWALSRQNYAVHIQPPYSRPYKTFRRSCVPWYWKLVQTPRLSDREVCPVEQLVVPLLTFPAAFNGQMYGMIRTVSPFIDPVLEQGRNNSLLSPRFSLDMWVYIVEYCPLSHLNAAKACMLVGHVSTKEQHLTPCILVDNNGFIQVEVAGPDMYVAQKTLFSIPKHQWVQILVCLQHRTWSVSMRYGKDFNTTIRVQERFFSDVHYNDTEGTFLLGGADGRLGSILGYMGHVKLYRGRVMTLDQLRLPESTDPMFQLSIEDTGEQCRQFLDWVHHHVDLYTHKAAIYQNKHFCPNSFRQLLTKTSADTLLKSCPQRLGMVEKDKKRVARLLRYAALRDGHVTSREEAAIAQKLLDSVTTSAEEHGLKDLHQSLPLLEQSLCLGNMDAAFTLAAFLNNGVGTTTQERRSLSLLLQGVVKKHRLSTLALGHRHAMGSDGVPRDKEVAYMYYKDVGDKTKEDRETHPEDHVLTEIIRLMDEQTLEQQTDESGDIFFWLKHQAQQGVTSAQLHLAHLYFWGSQGMRRNLQAARVLFQQGADQGDTDSLYNLGIMDLLGRGGSKKNETSGKENLLRAARKKHPYAISALGWLALEKERNYTKAAAYFEQAITSGFMDAGYYLGHMHQNGIYPNKTSDLDKAVGYYQWAAARGHIIAGLLFAYYQHRGTPKKARDPHMAMEWARYIAEQNGVVGKILRGGVKAYREGNIGLAAYHYLLASEAGTEVASFNMAWLCEEFKESVTAYIKKECQWRHYNFTVQREDQFVDPYSYIKMGDHFWYGCQGQRNTTQAAKYYAAAAKKKEPHALFNLAFMVEEGAKIPASVWQSLHLSKKHYSNNVTLLLELYERCRESKKSEAFIPCSLAMYRVWLLDLWDKYHLYLKTSTFLGGVMALVGTVYFVWHCIARWRHNNVQLYQL